MKTYLRLLIAAVIGTLFCTIALAQTAAATTAPAAAGALSADAIVQWLTPLLVPLIIALFKKVAPSIPSWALPVIAPVLGMLGNVITSYATGHSLNLVAAAALGLAGVGIREIKDQLVPAAAPAS